MAATGSLVKELAKLLSFSLQPLAFLLPLLLSEFVIGVCLFGHLYLNVNDNLSINERERERSFTWRVKN